MPELKITLLINNICLKLIQWSIMYKLCNYKLYADYRNVR